MSEPELPGIPPAPPPPKPPWYRRVLARHKRPGFAVILLAIVTEIPDWKGRLDFWLGAAHDASGYASVAAALIGSPFFSIGLAGAGVAWLLFVGEPRGALRQRWIPYLGWSILAICLTAIIITAGWGAIQYYITKEVTARTQSQFWYLTEKQKTKLARALDDVPQERRFPIQFDIVEGSPQANTMANDMIEIFLDHGWNVHGSKDPGLRADLLGIVFALDMDLGRRDKDLPPHAMDLAKIFNKAGLKYTPGWQRGFDENSLVIDIGSRPPDS